MIIEHKGKDVKLPDFLIVGATKSGTTSLHYYLKQHPQVFMPKTKELFFFSFLDGIPPYAELPWWKENIVRTLEDYISRFKDAQDKQVAGEASPSYLYTHKDTIRNIKKVYQDKYKDLKIVIILRNPAERAWSQFIMNKRDEREPLDSFGKATEQDVISQRLKDGWPIGFDYIGFGMYYVQVKSFLDEFKNVKVFLYDELCADASEVVKDLYGFLGVDDGFITNVEEKYNISGDIRHKWLNTMLAGQYPLKGFLKSFIPYDMRQKIKYWIQGKIIEKQEMPDDIKKELISLYKDNILKLQDLLKRDLSSWLKA